MRSTNRSREGAALRKALAHLVLAAAAEAALVIAHFAYGAHLYDEPSREHVVVPVVVALGLLTSLAALLAWRPTAAVRWLLSAVVVVPFVGVFGVYHGAFGHGAKLLLFAAGVSPERLLAIFDSPDFAVPGDALFEVSGLATFLASAWVAHALVRLLRVPARHIGAASAPQSTVRGAH